MNKVPTKRKKRTKINTSFIPHTKQKIVQAQKRQQNTIHTTTKHRKNNAYHRKNMPYQKKQSQFIRTTKITQVISQKEHSSWGVFKPVVLEIVIIACALRCELWLLAIENKVKKIC